MTIINNHSKDWTESENAASEEFQESSLFKYTVHNFYKTHYKLCYTVMKFLHLKTGISIDAPK